MLRVLARRDGLLRRLILGGLILSLAATAAEAAPLTCDQFRDRLNGALAASGDPDVQATAYTVRSAASARGKSYDWTGGEIAGTMKCGPADQFEELYVGLRFVDRDKFADQVKRFVTFNGAAICSLVADGPVACANAGKLLLQNALKQMGAAYNHGSQSPSGLTDRVLAPGVSAELTSAPTLMTFVIGPGRGGTLDDARQPLASAEPKTEE